MLSSSCLAAFLYASSVMLPFPRLSFINPSGLRSSGANLFQETEASGAPVEANPGTQGLGTIQQRFTEVSNVDVTEELVNMIITQRAYEVNSKSVQTADKLLEVANTLVR